MNILGFTKRIIATFAVVGLLAFSAHAMTEKPFEIAKKALAEIADLKTYEDINKDTSVANAVSTLENLNAQKLAAIVNNTFAQTKVLRFVEQWACEYFSNTDLVKTGTSDTFVKTSLCDAIATNTGSSDCTSDVLNKAIDNVIRLVTKTHNFIHQLITGLSGISDANKAYFIQNVEFVPVENNKYVTLADFIKQKQIDIRIIIDSACVDILNNAENEIKKAREKQNPQESKGFMGSLWTSISSFLGKQIDTAVGNAVQSK
jgi:hypothetical protein